MPDDGVGVVLAGHPKERRHEASSHFRRHREQQHPGCAGRPAGQPIAESNALFIPTAIYPFPGGPGMAWRAMSGGGPSRLAPLGWKLVGILGLSGLPSIEEAAWVPTVRDADALLFWGGDPLFLANWMRRSGLTDLLPTLRSEAVYVGVSAGSIAAASTFVETYTEPPRGTDGPLKSEDI